MSEETTTSAFKEEVKLKGNLGLIPLILMGVAYMSPICIYLYYGIMTQMTKGMYSLAILITGIAMSLTALSYAKMSRAIPAAGSVYTYVEKSINPHLGFVAGWAIIADYLMLPMVCYLSFGLYTNALIPAVPVWAWILLGILVVTFLNCRGVALVAFINNIITIIPIVFVVVAFICVITYIGSGGGSGTFLDSTAFYNPKLFDRSSVIAASAILACGFVGFDAISTLAEEAKDPQKNIPRAIILTCVCMGAVYVVMGYIMQLSWPMAYAEMKDSNTGILELFVYIGKPWLSTALSIINVLTALACCLAAQTAVARVFYGMGRDGFLPKKFFGYLHPKYNTPIKNVLLTSVVGLSAIFFAENLAGAASLISFGALVGFAFVNISVIAFYYIKGKQRSTWNIFTCLVIPAIAAISCIYLLFGLQTNAKLLGASWLLFGIIYLAIKTKGFREYPEGFRIDS